jgi:gamma-glutamylcyclotransferase (GGCT)/AIG2-like uncharacterized protein YtfP
MKSCKTTPCPKAGIKIHETTINNYIKTQQDFYNKIKEQNRHTGVRIEDSRNEYKEDPFDGFDPFKNMDHLNDMKVTYNTEMYNQLDLNLDNYSRKDLYSLFGLKHLTLTDDNMRESKKIVLKTHPDKSRLEPKFFLFFSKAYKKLYGIYEFQNRSSNKKIETTEYGFDDDKVMTLDNLFDKKKELKEPKHFQQWFNKEFEKHKLEDINEDGYGSWLKTEEGIIDVGIVGKADMDAVFERQKKQLQSIVVYNGVNELSAPVFSGSSLIGKTDNYTSGVGSGSGYTDLRQAYTESVIPVTEEDYNKVQKFKNVNEYKSHRENETVVPLDKQESMKQLYKRNKEMEEESAALAYHYAKESEKAKKNQESFWSGLKQLTNW